MKESLWLYILCFKVPYVAPMYCLIELLVFTVDLYTTFICRQFPSSGHDTLSLQLYCLLGWVLLWMVSIFLLWPFMIWDMLLVQLWLTFILFLLKIFVWGLWLEKCLLIRFRKIPIDVWCYAFIVSRVEPSWISFSVIWFAFLRCVF